jgi:hypothetical protein
LLNQNERWIQHYDLLLRPARKVNHVFHLKHLIDPLKQRFESHKAVELLDNDTAAIRIVDFQIDEPKDALILLIQYADTKVSDPAFSKIETGELRVEPKLEGEGIAVSAHVVISLKEKLPGTSTFFALVEEVPGLSKTRIERFLTSEFEAISEGRFFYKNKSGKEKPCRPIAQLNGYLSDTFADSLKTGELKAVQFIKTEVVENGLDERNYVVERENVLKIKIVPKLKPDSALSALQNLFNRAKNTNVDEMRVRISYQDSRPQTVPVDLSRTDIQNTLFIKVNMIKSETAMAICERQIRKHFSSEMVALLNGSAK